MDPGRNGRRRSDLRRQQAAARGRERAEIGRQAAVRDLIERQQRRLNVAGQRGQVPDLRHHVVSDLALNIEGISQLAGPSRGGLPVVIRYV